MKVNTKTVWQMTDNGMHIIEQESHEYEGPVAECFGGDSDTSSEVTTITETNQAGIQDNQGLAFASGSGDLDIAIETTDLGAIDQAFDFGQAALQFGNDQAGQAAQLAESAIASTGGALRTVQTGGVADLANIGSRTLIFGGLAIVALVIFLNRRK